MEASLSRKQSATKHKSSPDSMSHPAELHEAIRRRAQEIYEKSGRVTGRDVQNWIQAEAEILREHASRSSRRAAIKVRVNGVEYVGEYTPASSGGYTPGEFSAAGPVSVRFDGDKMYVRRPSGQELETRIIKKVG